MATELEDKQGKTSINNPDPGQAYADREFGGITSPDNYDRDAEDPTSSLSNQESEAGSGGSDSTGKAASAKELNKAEGLYNGNDSGSGASDSDTGDSRRFLSRKGIGSFLSKNKKRTIGGSIVGVVVGGGIFGASLLSGPLQFIHFAQNLQKFHFSEKADFDNDRTFKVLIYALAGNTAKGRLGPASNAAANQFEKRMIRDTGMRPIYSQPGGRFVGFEIKNPDKAFSTLGGANDKDSKRLQSIAGKGAEFKTAGEASSGRQAVIDIDGNKLGSDVKILDLSNVSLKDRRLMTRIIGRSTGTSNIASSVGSRLMIKRGGIDFHPLKNIKRNKTDSLLDYREKRKQERIAQLSSGNVPNAGVGAGESEVDAEGKPIGGADEKIAAQGANDAINNAKGADSKALQGIKTGINVAKGPAVVIGILCAVKSVGDSAQGIKYENTMKLMRFGASYLTVASQVMSGQGLNLDELGALSETLYDNESKLGWDSAKSIQAENGEPQTGPDIPKESIPASDDEKRDIFKAVDKIKPLEPVCDTINKVAGLPVIRQISSIISKGTKTVINPLISFTGYTLDELTQIALTLIAGKAVNLAATGPEAGNLANYGARLMANDQFISTGARKLNKAEEVALKTNQLAEVNETVAQRYFDPYLATSLTGKLVDTLPINTNQASDMFSSSLTNFGSVFKSAFTKLTVPKTLAATKYDYGFPKFAYSEAEQNDDRFEDPFKNEESLMNLLTQKKAEEAACVERAKKKGEPYYPQCELGYSSLYELNTGDSDFTPGDGDGNSDEGSDKNLDPYGKKCFSTQIEESGALKTYGSIDMAILPSSCQDSREVFLRYRFYIADTITAKSLSCSEGDEAACDELGFNGVAAEASSGVSNPTGVPSDVYSASDQKKCEIGTDGGIQQGYREGNAVPIRVCILNGIDINVSIEKNLDALLKAAKEDGITFRGGGFRSMEEQQELYTKLCIIGDCKPPAARPGFSNHQMGLAIDFVYNDEQRAICYPKRSSACTGHPGFEWLKKNAGKFGLKNLPSEAWHWSVNGG